MTTPLLANNGVPLAGDEATSANEGATPVDDYDSPSGL